MGFVLDSDDIRVLQLNLQVLLGALQLAMELLTAELDLHGYAIVQFGNLFFSLIDHVLKVKFETHVLFVNLFDGV